MQIELRPLEQVQPYPGNPRVNDDAVDAVAASLKEFGFRQPIVVDAQGVIIVGHTRWKAARKLGLAKVPVHVATDLPPEKVKAYRIADNQTATLAEWDFELLPIELKDLQQADYDLNLLGFDQDELAHLLDGDLAEGLTDPDAVPEPPDEPITQRGDIWVLGNHRLMCGDSSSAADLDRLLACGGGHGIDLVSMDPPYNVKVEPRSNNAIAAGLSSFPATNAAQEMLKRDQGNSAFTAAMQKKKSEKPTHANDHADGFKADPGRDLHRRPGCSEPTHKKMRPKDRPLANDFVSDDAFDRMLLDWFGNASRVLKPGGSFYIWGGYANIGNYPAPLAASGLYFSQAIIWDKQHPVLTRKDFMGAHELAFYGWKEGAGHHFYGPNNATDLWHVKKVNPQSMVHLTEKPVELAVRSIQYSSLPGQNVLDLFGGSGSTLIAAEQTGRRAFLMELDALYCDVIVDRWSKFTGKKAERIPGAASTAPCMADSVSPPVLGPQ